MTEREATRTLLDLLSAKGLRRLCDQTRTPRSGSKPQLIVRLEEQLQEPLDEVMGLLRNKDLESAADTWCKRRGLELRGARSRANTNQWRRLLRQLIFEGCAPAADSVVAIDGTPFSIGPKPARALLEGGDDERPEPAGAGEGTRTLADDHETRDERGDDDSVAVLSTSSSDFGDLESERQGLDDEPVEDDPEEVGARNPGYEAIRVSDAAPEDRRDVQLEDFQREAVEAMRAHFRSHGAGILCLPTGGGKTRTSLEWLLKDFVGKGERVLWVTHRLPLLDQVHEELRGLAWLLSGLRTSFSVSRYQGVHENATGDVVLASAAALVARKPTWAQLGRPAILCFDEAHRAVARRTWEAVSRIRGRTRQTPLLGLTATPFRRTDAGTQMLHRHFGEEPLFEKSFKDLVEAGFLARPVFQRQKLRSTEALTLTAEDRQHLKRFRDFPPAVLSKLARHAERTREIVRHWLANRSRYGKTLVFACDIEHAAALNHALRQNGVSAAELHSQQPPETRSGILRRFRDGQCDVLVNVGMLIEGANVPDTKTVLMARPTLSPVLYRQMIGRGSRGPKAVPGKTEFFVVDCVDNFAQHGLQLAGAKVASELADDLRSQSTTVARSEEEHQQIRRATHQADAALLLRGFDPEQYRLWGALEWTGQSGQYRAVAVFVETVEAVARAVDVVEECLRAGEWRDALALTETLDHAGAVRAADWTEMLEDVRSTGTAPTLSRIEGLSRDEASAVPSLVAELASKAQRVPAPAVIQAAQEAMRTHPALRDAYVDAVSLGMAALSLAASAASAAQAPPEVTPSQLARAYAELGMAVSAADGHVHDAERRVLAISMPRAIPGAPDDAAVEIEPPADPSAAASLLRDHLGLGQRLVVLDYLFRIAIADGVFVPEEGAMIRRVHEGLGLPADELEHRLKWYQPGEPAPTLEGYVTCRGCASTFVDDGSTFFCGHCGTQLKSRGIVDAAATLPN